MRIVRALVGHPLAGPALRYGIAGAIVACVYPGLPFATNWAVGVPIQVLIPIAYVLAVCLHFFLQRHFVFRHVPEFALSRRGQIGRYVAIGAVQYPTTALATALLPGALGITARVTFVLVTFATSVTFFLFLRGFVFHGSDSQRVAATLRE
jgi:putative flippase GtrA